MRREGIVGQRFPVGQQRDAQARREPRDLVGEALRGERVGADDREHPLLRGRIAPRAARARAHRRSRAAAPRGACWPGAGKSGTSGGSAASIGWTLRGRESRARRRSRLAAARALRRELRWPPSRRRWGPSARASANRARIIRGHEMGMACLRNNGRRSRMR